MRMQPCISSAITGQAPMPTLAELKKVRASVTEDAKLAVIRSSRVARFDIYAHALIPQSESEPSADQSPTGSLRSSALFFFIPLFAARGKKPQECFMYFKIF